MEKRIEAIRLEPVRRNQGFGLLTETGSIDRDIDAHTGAVFSGCAIRDHLKMQGLDGKRVHIQGKRAVGKFCRKRITMFFQEMQVNIETTEKLGYVSNIPNRGITNHDDETTHTR